jgi:hypothetical protein
VGAGVDLADLDPLLPEVRDDIVVHAADLLRPCDSLRNAALISYDEEEELAAQAAEGGCGLGKECDLRGVDEVPAVLDQGPVAVEKDGKPLHGGEIIEFSLFASNSRQVFAAVRTT